MLLDDSIRLTGVWRRTCRIATAEGQNGDDNYFCPKAFHHTSPGAERNRAGRSALTTHEMSGFASAFSSLQLSTPMIASKMVMTAMLNGLARVRFATAIASAPHRGRAAVAGLQVAQPCPA